MRWFDAFFLDIEAVDAITKEIKLLRLDFLCQRISGVMEDFVIAVC